MLVSDRAAAAQYYEIMQYAITRLNTVITI